MFSVSDSCVNAENVPSGMRPFKFCKEANSNLMLILTLVLTMLPPSWHSTWQLAVTLAEAMNR